MNAYAVGFTHPFDYHKKVGKPVGNFIESIAIFIRRQNYPPYFFFLSVFRDLCGKTNFVK